MENISLYYITTDLGLYLDLWTGVPPDWREREEEGRRRARTEQAGIPAGQLRLHLLLLPGDPGHPGDGVEVDQVGGRDQVGHLFPEC